MREQSRKGSLIEVCLSTATGFVVSMLVWRFIAAPVYHIPVTFAQNFGITCIFTVASITRSYCWRRAFNWWQKRL